MQVVVMVALLSRVLLCGFAEIQVRCPSCGKSTWVKKHHDSNCEHCGTVIEGH
jgi:ribosomal protein S27E